MLRVPGTKRFGTSYEAEMLRSLKKSELSTQ